MAEHFSFTKHLRTIVKPVLAAKGFTTKNTKFTRPRDTYAELIYVQRSMWNHLSPPYKFYLNLQLISDSIPIHSGGGRFDRPTNLAFPAHYQTFFSNELTNEERNRLMKSFTFEEKSEIEDYNSSRRWEYSTEDELISQLHLLRNTLEMCADKIFDALGRSYDSDPNNFGNNCWNIVNSQYFSLLPPESRWTID
ncbi:DUF4304 domain-containing protein [Pseudanabaena sp. BC1403]|uniref:DUF4304 domain-containing protein n=1 Tax=Pseudanabaena sp. BC1403 TaxID=2043171 RepID=UPI000CD918F9|nr:DUF4304 domain-containing protein [Pseudanabaena sp. BC1403]